MRFKEEFIVSLKKKRKEEGITQAEIAERLHVSGAAVCRFEKGLRPGSLIGIAYAFELGIPIYKSDIVPETDTDGEGS